MKTTHTSSHVPALYFSHTHNFCLLLCHFFFGNELSLSFLIWEMGVSQELFYEFRAVQVIFGLPCVFRTVNRNKKLLMQRARQTCKRTTVQHVTYSVKPFHFRKYSTLPSKILRRIIFSTTNSWTTVSSVFLCLAVCFFLILPQEKNQTKCSLYYFIWWTRFSLSSQNMAVPFKTAILAVSAALHLPFLPGAQHTPPSGPRRNTLVSTRVYYSFTQLSEEHII